MSLNLVLASKRTKGRKHFVVKTFDCDNDRFKTPEGTEIQLNKDDFFAFFIDFFSSAQSAPVLGNDDLRYHLSRLQGDLGI